jgi:predicted dehydrogenase
VSSTPRAPSPTSSTAPLGVAVVGCGAIATLQHLPTLVRLPATRVVAVVDRDVSRAREVGRRFGVPVAAASLAEARSAGAVIDAVLVATPNHLHAPVALEALAQGYDVLVEKPMALDGAQARAMVEAARAVDRLLAVGLEFRFAPGNVALRDLVASGWLGRLERVELVQGVIPRWPYASDYVLRRETAGGGVLFDYGAHLLDLLFFWLGEPTAVRYRDDARGGLESNCEIDFQHSDGVTSRLETSRTRNLANRVRFVGERGEIDADVWTTDPAIRLRPRGGRPLVARAPDGRDFAATFDTMWSDFADACRSRRAPQASGEAGLLVQSWIDRCYAVREPLRQPWESADLERPA